MVNKSKRTGTEGENRVLGWLKPIWPLADRGGNKPGHDIVGVPVPVEVKRQKTLQIPAWTRWLRELHGDQWVLFALPRDLRAKDAHPELMIMPADMGVRLLALVDHYEPSFWPDPR